MDTLAPFLAHLVRGNIPAAALAAQAHAQALAEAGHAEQAAAFTAAWEAAHAVPVATPAYLGRFRHGKASARVYDARGVAALALSNHDGTLFLRVAHDPDGMGQPFTDYDWRHDDASVRIDDTLAAFYVRDDGVCVFDHAPQVLGIPALPAQRGDPPAPEERG